MKVIKTASGKTRIKMSRKEWTDLGKKAGWAEELDYGSRPGAEEATRALKLLNSLKKITSDIHSPVASKEKSYWDFRKYNLEEDFENKSENKMMQKLLKPLSQCSVLSAESRKYYSSWLGNPLYHIMSGNTDLMEKINQDISTLERDTQAPTEEANAAALLNADWSNVQSPTEEANLLNADWSNVQ